MGGPFRFDDLEQRGWQPPFYPSNGRVIMENPQVTYSATTNKHVRTKYI